MGFFQIWRASGINSELQRYYTAIDVLVFAALMLFVGWFHYHKVAPKLTWFQDVESMLNDHLAGLLGLGSLFWAGYQVHVSLPINQFLNAGVDPKEIPLPQRIQQKTKTNRLYVLRQAIRGVTPNIAIKGRH
ncbi:hypothetical protein RYX36_027744, partial [Vicia faba]